ncbi:MAG: type II toxin-antitoxin system PemK/MazF family toxin [Firmicutes bacterium]|nr:type II toxin-antitoxin system PemK/MazF family toxin [Bacillota bacterium]
MALSFDPQSGHEQRGRRTLVVSNGLFNRHTGSCIACPITSTRRDYLSHAPIPEGQGRYRLHHGGAGEVDRLTVAQRPARRKGRGSGLGRSTVNPRCMHVLSTKYND